MCVDRPLSRLSKRTTRNPRPASPSQNSSGQPIIWVASPMIRRTGGSVGSPKSSQQSSISGLTRQNCSGTLRTLPPAASRDPTGELVAALDEHRAERAIDLAVREPPSGQLDDERGGAGQRLVLPPHGAARVARQPA